MTQNFYTNHFGKEQPIVFKAADIVNRPAPAGYHWELDLRPREERIAFLRLYIADRKRLLEEYLSKVGNTKHDRWASFLDAKINRAEYEITTVPLPVDGYICVKDKSVPVTPERVPYRCLHLSGWHHEGPLGYFCNECNSPVE